ncbi:MAG TPA: branched-chain amino acid ABC transporter permease [Planctomycetota bacterium]|nr:branched-chain amino acid ABC transporter permease [Planctomycetota bacterium]
MSAEVLLLQLANGLSFGVIFALIAAGITLMWGIMDFINMAHGDLYMLGAYGVWLALVVGVASFWLALPLAVAGVLAIGLLLRATVLRPVFGRAPLQTLLATYGVGLVLQQGVLALFGPFSKEIPLPVTGLVTLGPLRYPAYRLVVIALGIALITAAWLFIQRSTYGIWIRAVAQDRTMTAALGVPVPRVYTVVFGLGSALAGIGGALAAPLFGIGPTMGADVILLAFIVVMIGGLGNYAGSVVGGVLIGEVIALGALWLQPTEAYLVALGLLLLLLLVRPQGLLRAAR